VVAICTGCRPGELLALTWEDVATSSATLSVDKSAQRLGGVRDITLPAEAVAALGQQAAWQQRRGASEPWVFTAEGGGRLSPDTVRGALRRECLRLRLPRLTPRALRHLHATLLLGAGVPVPEVAHRLGHATPAITMSTYAHLLRPDDARATAAIAEALGVG